MYTGEARAALTICVAEESAALPPPRPRPPPHPPRRTPRRSLHHTDSPTLSLHILPLYIHLHPYNSLSPPFPTYCHLPSHPPSPHQPRFRCVGSLVYFSSIFGFGITYNNQFFSIGVRLSSAHIAPERGVSREACAGLIARRPARRSPRILTSTCGIGLAIQSPRVL